MKRVFLVGTFTREYVEMMEGIKIGEMRISCLRMSDQN